MKKLSCIILILIIAISTTLPCYANKQSPRLVDEARLLDSSDREYVKGELDKASEKLSFDIVIVTVNSTGTKTPMEFADDYYDEHGYGYGENYDGILLLISMQERDWYISTCGYGITAFTDAGLEFLGKEVVYYLSDEMYDDAFLTFITYCELYVEQARTGTPYDVGNMPKLPFDALWNLIICLVIGFIAAFITTAIMKGKLKSVRSKPRAEEYVRQGSLDITNATDLFLYRTINRKPRPKDTSSSGGSSSHRSSSGRSHGGRGGKF